MEWSEEFICTEPDRVSHKENFASESRNRDYSYRYSIRRRSPLVKSGDKDLSEQLLRSYSEPICARWRGWQRILERSERKDRRMVCNWKILLYPYRDKSKSCACVRNIKVRNNKFEGNSIGWNETIRRRRRKDRYDVMSRKDRKAKGMMSWLERDRNAKYMMSWLEAVAVIVIEGDWFGIIILV